MISNSSSTETNSGAEATADIPRTFTSSTANAHDIAVSFEFFPPKSEKMEQSLWQAFDKLEVLAPRFVSVTYGAGGSTRERTHRTVAAIAKRGSVPPAAHLTCVGASREEINKIAQAYWNAGVRHIVALRGDAPETPETPKTPASNASNASNASRFQPHPQGYANAAELVAGLRRLHDFDISVAAYPETHPEATSPQSDLDNLKRKLDAGANCAISQFFFEPATFLRFRDRVAAAGIDAPLVAGILPVSNVASTRRIAAMCGADIPAWMDALFDGLDDHPTTRQLVAATIAATLCRHLYIEGVRDFHFYTLNRADLSYAICHLLGLRPQPTTQTATQPATPKETAHD